MSVRAISGAKGSVITYNNKAISGMPCEDDHCRVQELRTFRRTDVLTVPPNMPTFKMDMAGTMISIIRLGQACIV